jgi:UDP-N-acetylglucosamine 4-epimerase
MRGMTTAYQGAQERLKGHPRLWLVTGAAGFIGSHLVEALLRLNQRVIGLDNHSTGCRRNLEQARSAVSESQWRGFRHLEGDIRAPDICRRACRGVDYVLHQAALGGTARSIEQPGAIHEVNVTGFLNVLLAARDAGASRLVYAGSNAQRASSPCAATKEMNERYAAVFADCYAFDSIGLRYFNVYGARQDPEGPYSAVVPRWIAGMLRGEPVFIDGDGTSVRDFCHVDDIVQANLLAATAEDPAAVNQVYDVGLGAGTSLVRLFESISRLLAPRHAHLRGLRPVHRAVRGGAPRSALADIGKAGERLGYRPLFGVEEGLARTVGWYESALAARTPAERAVPGLRTAFGGRIGSYA